MEALWQNLAGWKTLFEGVPERSVDAILGHSSGCHVTPEDAVCVILKVG